MGQVECMLDHVIDRSCIHVKDALIVMPFSKRPEPKEKEEELGFHTKAYPLHVQHLLP